MNASRILAFRNSGRVALIAVVTLVLSGSARSSRFRGTPQFLRGLRRGTPRKRKAGGTAASVRQRGQEYMLAWKIGQ